MNSSKQESDNELKVIGKIEVDTKPKGYNEKDGKSTAQLGYVHKALDKLIAGLNKEFVPKLDDVLNNNSKSVNQLKDTLGDSSKGLVKELDELKGKVQNLENAGNDGSGFEWDAPQFKGADTEFMAI